MSGLFSGYVSIPTGVAVFPRELYKPPRSWANAVYNITHWTEQPKVSEGVCTCWSVDRRGLGAW
jgi:hypothetical protein